MIHNDIALPPEEFLKRGGGDCEDWAILTCDMLAYWGEEAYVAVIDSPSGMSDHAIVLWKVDDPLDMDYYLLEDNYITDITNHYISHGYYLPIDYDLMGGVAYSDSIWPTLRYLFEYKSLYWREM